MKIKSTKIEKYKRNLQISQIKSGRGLVNSKKVEKKQSQSYIRTQRW